MAGPGIAAMICFVSLRQRVHLPTLLFGTSWRRNVAAYLVSVILLGVSSAAMRWYRGDDALGSRPRWHGRFKRNFRNRCHHQRRRFRCDIRRRAGLTSLPSAHALCTETRAAFYDRRHTAVALAFHQLFQGRDVQSDYVAVDDTRNARLVHRSQFFNRLAIQRTGSLLLAIALHATLNMTMEFETAIYVLPTTIIFQAWLVKNWPTTYR
jgi:hypothetical protein